MKAVTHALMSVAGIAGLVGAILLALLVWFFSPALLAAENLQRWLLSCVPLLIWLVVMIVLALRRQRRDSALIDGVTKAAEKKTAAKAEVSHEEREVGQRLADALAAIKAAKGNQGGYLYERPWYVIIGPPGAGKTTAIVNSGLKFPLPDSHKLKGVGGTRNCAWMIAEQAVIIDTAGRYTTQDSDAVADKAGWERFLDLLRRERARMPLNGVIVAFGADMLSNFDNAEREANAHAVRRRVREIEQRLGQKLPVYLLVCKMDLVIGFSEYFENLDKDARTQVWGMTFPAEATVSGYYAGFRNEFAILVKRLQARVLERLSAERGAEQRSRIVGFPAQFASLESPLDAFIEAAFSGSRDDPAPFLRGVYFSSGTQEGTPIDRLTGVLSRSFGLDARIPAAVMGQEGRSYFLGRLLREVIFNEARLASRDRMTARRWDLTRWGAWLGAACVVLGFGAWGVSAMRKEADRGESVSTALKGIESTAAAVPLGRVTLGNDLTRILPHLRNMRDLPSTAKGDGAFAVSQEPKLIGAGLLAYDHALERILLPRLLARLEVQIRAGMQKPEYLYEATKVYLMLGRQGPLDRGFVKEWMSIDWAVLFPGAMGAPVRDELMGHLDQLLAFDFKGYPLDGALVDLARRVFSRLPMANRVYSRLRGSAGDIAAWRPADALGAAGVRLFALGSGKPLSDSAIPGLFTVEGLHRGLLPRLPKAMLEAASESWVLGPEAASSLVADPSRLENDLLKLYADDYVRVWQAMLADIVLQPFRSLPQAAESLNVLGAPNSPAKDLIKSIVRQVSPGTAPAATGVGVAPVLDAAKKTAANAAATALPPTGSGVAQGVTSRLAEVVGTGSQPNAAATVAKIVEDRFRRLIDYSGQPLEATIAVMNELYSQVASLASAPPGAPPPTAAGLDPAQKLQGEAQRAPEPVSRWLASAIQSSGVARSGGARASIAAAASQQLGPLCKGVEARFPFRRDPNAPDMPLDDFVRLFGPGGAFDQFFAQTLRNFVDTSQRPWRPFTGAGATPPPVGASEIAQFQRAAAIRDAFFPPALPGQQNMGLKFDLTPVNLDAGARGASLDVEGTKFAIVPGANGTPAIQLQWPSRGSVGLIFDPSPTSMAVANDGAWASLKFVARGRLQSTGAPELHRLTIQQGERSAVFDLRARSIANPFVLRELAEFRCPQIGP